MIIVEYLREHTQQILDRESRGQFLLHHFVCCVSEAYVVVAGGFELSRPFVERPVRNPYHTRFIIGNTQFQKPFRLFDTCYLFRHTYKDYTPSELLHSILQ